MNVLMRPDKLVQATGIGIDDVGTLCKTIVEKSTLTIDTGGCYMVTAREPDPLRAK